MRSVVAGEEDDCALVHPQFLELVQDFAHVRIESRDHRRLVFLRLRPVLLRVRRVAGHFHAFVFQFVVRMGNGVGEVKEEGMLLIDANEIQRRAREQIVGILTLPAIGVAPQLPLALVAPKIFRVIIMRLDLIEIAEPFIKPVSVRNAGRSFVAQSPFADDRRVVNGRFEHLGHRHIARLQRHARVAANPRMAGVHPRHEAAARRRANRAAGVALSEAHPFRSQSINVRSLDFLLTVTTRITVTQVVGENENDVRPALRPGAEPFEVRRLRVA